MREKSLNPARLNPSESAVETAADRRRSPRATYRVVFNVRPVLADGGGGGGGGGGGLGAPVEVILQDLSITGMGIIHSTAMSIGDQYEIPLMRGEDDATPMALRATVVRCEQLDDGLFSIGFEFNSSADAVDEGSRQLTGHPAPRD
jgi:hypothetical protein